MLSIMRVGVAKVVEALNSEMSLQHNVKHSRMRKLHQKVTSVMWNWWGCPIPYLLCPWPMYCRLGYHWPPFCSVYHLHLHVISPSDRIKVFRRPKYKSGTVWFKTVSTGAGEGGGSSKCLYCIMYNSNGTARLCGAVGCLMIGKIQWVTFPDSAFIVNSPCLNRPEICSCIIMSKFAQISYRPWPPYILQTGSHAVV